MKIYCKRILLALLVPMFLSACDSGEQQRSSAPSQKPNAPSVKKVDEVAPVPAVEAKKSEPPLRNPFQSYILLKRGEIDKSATAKGPLECCEIATFKVVAALVAGDEPYALVSGADNKRYIVRIGDKVGLNGGKISVINTEGITVKEILRDIDGNVVNVNEVKLSVTDTQEKQEKNVESPRNTRR